MAFPNRGSIGEALFLLLLSLPPELVTRTVCVEGQLMAAELSTILGIVSTSARQ